DPHDLLGRVGRGGDVVRGEDGEARQRPEPFADLLVNRERPAKEDRTCPRADAPEARSRNARFLPGLQLAGPGIAEVLLMRSFNSNPHVPRLAPAQARPAALRLALARHFVAGGLTATTCSSTSGIRSRRRSATERSTTRRIPRRSWYGRTICVTRRAR